MRAQHFFKFSFFPSLAPVSLLLLSACTGHLEHRLDRELGDLRDQQAEQTIAISEMRQDIRELTGRLDEMQHVSTGRTQALERSIEQLGNRLPPPAGVPEDLFAADEESISKIDGPAAAEYKKALQLIRGGEFSAAAKAFNEFAEKNPGTAYTDNAYFWAGISHMKSGQFDRAVVNFSDVYQKYPGEDFVPAALYYMGDSLFAMGSGEDGVLTFQKLVDEHPQSEFAERAKKRIHLPSTKR